MSRFKRTKIKSTKKSSVSIDEKIALLNKELKKTGLSEMTTDDVYVTGTEEPNPAYEDFIAASFGGKGFAMSGFGGASIGGATFDANGRAFGPDGSGPATTYLGLASGFGPSSPGDQRTPEHRKTGAFLWYWNGSGYSTLEWKFNNQNVDNSGGWASWQDTAFGFPHLVFISAIPGFDPALAAAVASAGGGGPFPDPDDVTPPTNPVFTKDRLGEPGFLPIDTAKRKAGDDMGTSPEAFDSFSEKSKGDKGEDDKGEDEDLVNGMTQEEVKKKYGHLSDEELKKHGIIRNPDGSYREMTASEKREYKELKDWQESMMKRFRGIFKNMSDSQLKNHLKKVGLWDKVFSIPKPNKFMERSIDNAMASAGRALRLKSASNMLSKYDDWLRKGAPGSVDVTNQIQQSSMNRLVKSINSLEVKSIIQKAIATAKGSNANNSIIPPKGPGFEYWSNVRTKADADWAAAADKVTKKLQKAVHSNLDLDNTLHNNVQIDRKLFRDSGGKKIVIVKTYQFRPGGSVKKAEGTLLGKFMTRMGIKLDTFGTGVTGWMGVAAASMGLRGAMMYGGSYSAPGMPMRITVQSGAGEKPTPSPLDVKGFKTGGLMFNSNEPQGDVLSEDVKLGYFDPEELNVDIEDLRKGIMPEYPKKAPPEMIDGYSATSKLAPRVVKGEPTIKITRKDLAKFHKLKKSEIDEFMNTVKRINNYLQKHPEELIYAQQRYPKDDPRLAALNWKMDQMNEAGKKYIDQNFKVNQTLFKRATERTKRNTALTNPDYIQKHYDELRGTIKPESKPTINRKSPSRFFKKPKKKSSMEAINDKIKQLDKDLLL